MSKDVSVRARRFVRGEEGQNLVEFALLLPVLVFLAMAIVQFGAILNDYIALENSVREGARAGAGYVYDLSLSKNQNDRARASLVETTLLEARGPLNTGATPAVGTTNFRHDGGWDDGCTGDCMRDLDLQLTFTDSSGGICAPDDRAGCYMNVRALYHRQIVLPFVGEFLADDPQTGYGASWIRLGVRYTVVIINN